MTHRLSNTPSGPSDNINRRAFVKASAAATIASLASSPLWARSGVHAGVRDSVRVGVIGCGGRGTGAAADALAAGENVQVHALADVFEHRLRGCRGELEKRGTRGMVRDDMCFTGFDAYKQLLQADVDMVILATPPHFRPMHFEAAVNAGKHVFMEKPCAVDGPGVRRVLASAAVADEKGLSVVAGTQRRHEASYLALIEQIRSGAIGEVVSARCWWNQGGLWVVEKTPQMSGMEWQVRNWLYFTWLSGDHIVEQHVHNLDVCNWVIGDHPVKCMGMGGRQVRTEAKYGNIFDHFAVEYEYPSGVVVASQCRQIDGCAGRVAEAFHGTKGRTLSSPGQAQVHGATSWRFPGRQRSPYEQEHVDLVASITGQSARLNEARNVAHSTLTAIMGRMSAYTGKEVTWEQALDSQEDLSPPSYEWVDIPVPPVAVPGQTPLR